MKNEMNDIPTPETDALVPTQGHKRTMLEYIETLEAHARRLERERDNALSDFRQADTDSIRALHERNEAREQLSVWKHEVDVLRQQLKEDEEILEANISTFIDLTEKANDLERRLAIAREALMAIADKSVSLEHAERMADRALKQTAPKP